MKILTLGFVAALTAAAPSFAKDTHTAPALHVGELADVLASMPEGDVANGAKLHQDYWCASCHGADGTASSRNYPSVAGQVATYTYKTLLDYRDGRRNEGTGRAVAMAATVTQLTDQELADLAAYYASVSAPKGTGDAAASAATLALVRTGDPDRLITPCASCHGVDGAAGIRPETPALAGLGADYLERTLRAYHSSARANDTAQGMRFFAQRLTDAEMKDLAAYYASLGQ